MIKAEQVTDLLGSQPYKVFSTFGFPHDVYSVCQNNDGLSVLDYRAFSFGILNKTVFNCTFYSSYPLPIMGIRFGDTQDQVIALLGAPTKVLDAEVADHVLTWLLLNLDVTFAVWFKDEKVMKIGIFLNQ